MRAAFSQIWTWRTVSFIVGAFPGEGDRNSGFSRMLCGLRNARNSSIGWALARLFRILRPKAKKGAQGYANWLDKVAPKGKLREGGRERKRICCGNLSNKGISKEYTRKTVFKAGELVGREFGSLICWYRRNSGTPRNDPCYGGGPHPRCTLRRLDGKGSRFNQMDFGFRVGGRGLDAGRVRFPLRRSFRIGHDYGTWSARII